MMKNVMKSKKVQRKKRETIISARGCIVSCMAKPNEVEMFDHKCDLHVLIHSNSKWDQFLSVSRGKVSDTEVDNQILNLLYKWVSKLSPQ